MTTPEPATTETSGFIHGEVYNGQTQAPLEGAIVTVVGVSGHVETDINGKFRFPTPDTGTYKLEISKDGFSYNQRKISVVTTQDTAVEVAYLLPVDTTTFVNASQGATLTNSNGKLEVMIPPDALSQDTNIHLTLIEEPEYLPNPLPDGYAFINFFFGEPSIAFDPPVTVSIQNRLGFDPGAGLPIYFWNRQDLVWEQRGTGYVTEDGQWIEGEWPSFSSGGFTTDVDTQDPPCPPSDPACVKNCTTGDPECPNPCDPGDTGQSLITYREGILSVEYDLPGVNVLGASENVQLIYNSNTAYPTASIPTSVDPTAGLPPDSVTFKLKVGAVSQEQEFAYNPQKSRQAYLFSAYTEVGGQNEWFDTGTYPYEATLSNNYETNQYAITIYNRATPPVPISFTVYNIDDKPVTYSSLASGRFAVNNRRAGQFGVGWGIAGHGGICLTDVTPTCSVLGYGDLSQNTYGI